MRTQRFTFLCTVDEKDALERLAAVWRRSRSDTIRLLIANALEQLFTGDRSSVETYAPGTSDASKDRDSSVGCGGLP